MVKMFAYCDCARHYYSNPESNAGIDDSWRLLVGAVQFAPSHERNIACQS